MSDCDLGLVQLYKIGCANRRAKVAGHDINAAVDWIKEENDAVETVEFGIETHAVA
jgi:hypothetical protein